MSRCFRAQWDLLLSLCTCRSLVHTCTCQSGVTFWVHSLVNLNEGPSGARRSAVLSGDRNVRVSRRRGSGLACMTLQMGYFEGEVSSESEVRPHILSGFGPADTPGSVQKYGTAMISRPIPCPPPPPLPVYLRLSVCLSVCLWHPAQSRISLI